MTPDRIDALSREYVEAALDASLDEFGDPLSRCFSVRQVHTSAVFAMVRDCHELIAVAGSDVTPARVAERARRFRLCVGADNLIHVA